MVTVSVHNQVREIRELDNVKAVNELLADPLWIYLGNATVSRVGRYSSTGAPVEIGTKAMVQTVRRVVHLVGRLPAGAGKLPL